MTDAGDREAGSGVGVAGPGPASAAGSGAGAASAADAVGAGTSAAGAGVSGSGAGAASAEDAVGVGTSAAGASVSGSGAGAASAAGGPILLEAQGVSVRYRIRGRNREGGRYLTALDSVSLAWRRGETLALVGESGSGKSTLGRVLLGLLPPTEGTVRYGGSPIDRAVERRLRREVQLIFQDPYQSLNPRSTVGEQVSAGLEIHRIGAAGVERTAIGLAALAAAGLRPPEAFWHRYPHQLSGGERQRVVIAGAMALAPQALVCDEPVSALDVSVRAQVLAVLAQLRAERNLSLLFITHDVSLARQMSDRIVVLYRGKVVETGPTAAVLADPQHGYTRRLLAAVPRVAVG